jgi:hypothetical protein
VRVAFTPTGGETEASTRRITLKAARCAPRAEKPRRVQVPRWCIR